MRTWRYDKVVSYSLNEQTFLSKTLKQFYDKKQLSTPRFAPFVAAGYFVAHSDFLREVPFDPFLPWIFMGEEIIMSSRLWTAGYDIFSPIQSVVGHIYVRRHKPKFWESVRQAFTQSIYTPLEVSPRRTVYCHGVFH